MKRLRTLIAFISIIIVLLILNRLLLYFEAPAENSSIKTFSDTIWYLIVTLTTVGYGDMYPITSGGKVIGVLYVIASFGMIGFLISTITKYIYTMIEERKLGYKGTNFEEHIVFIGWNEFSRLVMDEIVYSSTKTAIVTNNKDDIDLIYNEFGKKNTFVLFADYQNFEALQKINISKSSEVFVSFQDDTDSLIYVINFKKFYPNSLIVVSIENMSLKDTFLAAGVTYVIARNEIASKFVASYMFEPDVAVLNNEIISSAKTDSEYDNQEYKVIATNPYLGKNCMDVFFDIRKKYDGVLLGISKYVDGKWKVITNPGEKVIVEENDHLVIMLTSQTKALVEKDFGVPEGRV